MLNDFGLETKGKDIGALEAWHFEEELGKGNMATNEKELPRPRQEWLPAPGHVPHAMWYPVKPYLLKDQNNRLTDKCM